MGAFTGSFLILPAMFLFAFSHSYECNTGIWVVALNYLLHPGGMPVFSTLSTIRILRQAFRPASGVRMTRRRQGYAGYAGSPLFFFSHVWLPKCLSDLQMGVTKGDLAGSSACLRVLHGFEFPLRTLEHELLRTKNNAQ